MQTDKRGQEKGRCRRCRRINVVGSGSGRDRESRSEQHGGE